MIINIIGDCDKRPVLFTVMKICQTLGDVLLLTSNTRLLRLSDTGASGGHYQNTMIVATSEGIDDFMEDFTYDFSDFNYVIVDNIITADADATIYVKGLLETDSIKDSLEYVDNYEVIELYKNKLTDGQTLLRCEEFEAFKTACPINANIAEIVSGILAKFTGKPAKNLLGIAMTSQSTYKPKSGIKLKGGKR